MAGFFDRFRNPEKIRLRDEAHAEQAANDAGAREALAEQRNREEALAQLRQEERMAHSQWTYQDISDDMRGSTMSMAQLISENSVDFPFPYNGGCQGMLVIRKRDNQYEALFTVTNGQFDVAIGNYTMSTKVDDGLIQQWTGAQPDQGSATIMFVTNPVQFIRSFQKGDRVIVETQFYQFGNYILE